MKFPVLISYAYARKNLEGFEARANDPNVDILLDCGAFTAKNAGEEIRLEDYCSFLDKWKDKIFRYLALDVVGDPVATDNNLQIMLKAGYKPVPVHVLGDDQRRMDQLFELSDYVALAGLRRPHKGAAPKEYIVAKMKWAAGRNVHWLGYVREPMIASLKPYSCDSASWAGAQLFGSIDIYLGQGQWVSGTFQTRNKLLTNKAAMKVIRSLGYTMKQFNDPNCWRGASSIGVPEEQELSNVVTSDSWVRWVIDIGQRYGTRVFLAARGGGRREEVSIFAAIKRHEQKLYLRPTSI